ncbi:MAG: hypothetical protein Q4B26_12465 [Eubacteriales bacterium]|nr:hypothetical protein [Eubacteriales bacterium]
MGKIKLNTGERVEIVNSDDEVMGYFYFNPADLDILRRAKDVEKHLEALMKETTDENQDEINAKIIDEFEYLINDKTCSRVLFKYNTPLSIMANGQLYMLYVFEAIATYIETVVTERADKMVSKYTADYE